MLKSLSIILVSVQIATAPSFLGGQANLAAKSTLNIAAAGGGSNVAFDASAKAGCGVGIGTRVISITIGNNANRYVIVCTGAGDATIGDRTVDSVSSNVDGAFTLISSATGDDANYCRVEMWQKVAPTVGAHTITVTYSGGATDAAEAAAVSLYNVDQATPVGTPVVPNGTVASTTPNGAVTLGTDDMAVAVLFSDSDATLSWTSGTSRQVTTGCASDVCYGMATHTGSGSVSLQATTENFKYGMVVIPVNGAP
jgi:hypothetical protein